MILAGPSEFLTGDLTDWIVSVIDSIGYLGVAFLVALESVFPPISSEIVLPAAGFASVQGDNNVWLMIVAATVGSVVGAWILYLVAAAIGEHRLRRGVARYGRWAGVSLDDLDRADAWFDRHANVAVLVCRCVPLIRSLVSIPAGFRRMNPVTFTLYTALGSTVWNVVLIGAGYQLGDNWEQVADWVSRFQYLVIAGIVALVAVWVWLRFLSPSARRRRAEARADQLAAVAADAAEEEAASDVPFAQLAVEPVPADADGAPDDSGSAITSPPASAER
jgi:membrane protein DedA with SNARE-associated domain